MQKPLLLARGRLFSTKYRADLREGAYPCPNSVKYPHAATKNAMTAAIVKAFLAFGPNGSRGFFGGTGLRNFTTLSFISSSS